MSSIEKQSKILGLIGSFEENKGMTLHEIAEVTQIHPVTVKKMIYDIAELQKFCPIEIVSSKSVQIIKKKKTLEECLLDKMKILDLKMDIIMKNIQKIVLKSIPKKRRGGKV